MGIYCTTELNFIFRKILRAFCAPDTNPDIKKRDIVSEFLEQDLGRKMLGVFGIQKTGSLTEEVRKLGRPVSQALKTKTRTFYFK